MRSSGLCSESVTFMAKPPPPTSFLYGSVHGRKSEQVIGSSLVALLQRNTRVFCDHHQVNFDKKDTFLNLLLILDGGIHRFQKMIASYITSRMAKLELPGKDYSLIALT